MSSPLSVVSRLCAPRAAFVALVALATAYPQGAVHAQSITPFFISAFTVPGGGRTIYTYQFFATADTKVSAGDVFTFYDFAGLLGGADAPTFTPGQFGPNFDISIQNTGVTLSGMTPPQSDDPTLPNVTFTYTGVTLINPGPGSQILGTATLSSSQDPDGNFTPYAAHATKSSTNTPVNNAGFIAGPNKQVVAAVASPEPATFALIALGTLVGGIVGRRRKA